MRLRRQISIARRSGRSTFQIATRREMDRAVPLARRSSGEGERGSLDVKRAAEGAFIIYFSIAHGVADPPFECTLLAMKTVDLPVQKIFKKVKKKLARFREVQ